MKENTTENIERQFNDIFDQSPFGIICINKIGKILDVNPVFCKIAELPRDEFVGKSAVVLIKKFLSAKHVPIMLKRLKKLLTGELNEPYELDYKGKIIEFHPPSKTSSNSYMSFVRDVTQLRKAENKSREKIEELEAAELRLHSIIENVGVAIWEEDFTEVKAAIDSLRAKGIKDFSKYLDKHPKFVENAVEMVKVINVNTEALKMYKAKDKKDLMSSLQNTFTSESLIIFKKELIAIFNKEREFQHEEVTRDLEGNRVDIILKITFPKYSRMFDRILVSMMDITEKKSDEQKLKAQKEHIELINSILRHDISNDLSVINSAMNLYDDSPKEELKEEIYKRIQNSTSLIRRMKNLEVFLSQRSDLLPISIKKVVKEIKGVFPSAQITLDGNASVLADNKLFSVFKNIIQNSIRHGKSKVIRIKVIKYAHFCTIEISDDGTGIPEKAKEKLFEKGFKYGKTGHTGLGLYIVKRSIEEYGGSIMVEDNKPSGATMIIKLRLVV